MSWHRVSLVLVAFVGFAGSAGAQDPLAAAALKERLLAVNRPSAPFRIVDGSLEKADLVAEWRIDEAEWRDVFARARLGTIFRIVMKLDEARHELRAQDHAYGVEWKDGRPKVRSVFKGQMSGGQKRRVYEFTENGEGGLVYKYSFDIGEMKGPIKQVVAESGWKYKGIVFGKP